MSTQRPTVAPHLIAALIASTPDRVRNRLDRAPDIAANWDWRVDAEAWSVSTGSETVVLPLDHVASVEQLTCTCLLSPRCFHVLACLTRLEVAHVEVDDVDATSPDESTASYVGAELVEPTENQQHAACELESSVALLLRVGVANAGVVVQSSLLRAVHQCRAEGLHRLAALGLRVHTGTNEYRTRAPNADPAQLAEDIADALETSRYVLRRKTVASFWIGTARRQQFPIRPRKLHGLFAEPILTRSGFAGAAVYFLGEDDRIYTVSDVRPGEAQRARDAYDGGIELGPLVQPAKQLARRSYLGTDLTASQDGRLGRGKGIQIVELAESTAPGDLIQQRFQQSPLEQWTRTFAGASLPADARPGGWDLVFFEGTVLGAIGPELLFQVDTHPGLIRFAIANDRDPFFFRENLRMLSHAPGLRLRTIARINLQEPGVVYPLAVSPVIRSNENEEAPRLEIPRSMADRVCLGFDEIQRSWLIGAERSATVLNLPSFQSESDHPLGSLKRRWIALILAGVASLRIGNSSRIAEEAMRLTQSGFATGAALLNSLSCVLPDQDGLDAILATAIYLRASCCEYAKFRATLES